MRTFAIVWFVAACAMAMLGCQKAAPPPKTAQDVEVGRFMGTWHEISRLPFKWEEDCVGSSAKYEAIDDERFKITNYCWYKSFFGPMRKAKAEGIIVEDSKFQVSFFWPIYVDYWILHIDDKYEHTVIGTPDRKYLWIMSRSTSIDDATYASLVAIAQDAGFSVDKLIQTPHRRENTPQLEDTRDAGTGADTSALEAETEGL